MPYDCGTAELEACLVFHISHCLSLYTALCALQLFSNSDIGNLVKEQTPPDDYMDAVWDEAQPKQCLRPLGFNFRHVNLPVTGRDSLSRLIESCDISD